MLLARPARADGGQSPDAEELRGSAPASLFDAPFVLDGPAAIANYDITPDGNRFLMVKRADAGTRIRVVLNWFEEPKRLVPVP